MNQTQSLFPSCALSSPLPHPQSTTSTRQTASPTTASSIDPGPAHRPLFWLAIYLSFFLPHAVFRRPSRLGPSSPFVLPSIPSLSIQGKRLGLVARPLLSQSSPLVSFAALLFISSPNLVLRCRSLVPTRLTCEPLAPRVRRSLRPKRQTSSLLLLLLLLVSFNGFHLVCLSVHPLLFSPRHLCFDDRCLGRGFVLGWRSVLVTFLLAATFLCFKNSFPQNRNAAAVTFCLRRCLVCRWPGCTPPSHQSGLLLAFCLISLMPAQPLVMPPDRVLAEPLSLLAL